MHFPATYTFQKQKYFSCLNHDGASTKSTDFYSPEPLLLYSQPLENSETLKMIGKRENYLKERNVWFLTSFFR